MKGIINEAKKNVSKYSYWIVANSYQRRTNVLLTRSSKTNYKSMTGELTILTNNRRLFNCDNRRIVRTNYWLRVLIANNIMA